MLIKSECEVNRRKVFQNGGATMAILAYLILGLIAGLVARMILPDGQTGRWTATFVLGVAGAIIGGWTGSLIFGGGIGDYFDLRTWFVAILSAVIAPFIHGTLAERKSRV
jgi:uncharacterized membrane protein YeaQ/YmgE (transglycosylase-associated protein family)